MGTLSGLQYATVTTTIYCNYYNVMHVNLRLGLQSTEWLVYLRRRTKFGSQHISKRQTAVMMINFVEVVTDKV